MMVVSESSPFGSRARTQALLVLHLLGESYAREMARVLGLSLSGVQKALGSLERDGLVAGRAVGRTRLYCINPRAFARRELERYLRRLCEPRSDLRARVATLRRRPRRAGKPL